MTATLAEVAALDLPTMSGDEIPYRFVESIDLRLGPVWNVCGITVDGQPWLATGLDVHVRVGHMTTVIVHGHELLDDTGNPGITRNEAGELVFAEETVHLETRNLTTSQAATVTWVAE